MGLPVGASAPNTPANRRQTALPIDNNSINIDYQVPSSSRMLAENCARQRDNNANRNDDDLDDRVVAAFDVNQTSPSTTATTNTATTTTTATMINNGNNSIFVDHQNNNHGHQQEEHHQYNPIHPTAHHNQSNNNEQLSAICNHQLYMPPAESYSCQACVGHQRQECNNFTSDKMTSIHPSDDFTQNASHGFYDLREQGSFDGSSRAHEGSSSRPVSLESRYEHEEYQSSDESFHSHSHLSFGNSHQQQNHHQQVIHHRGHDEQPQQQISLHAQSQLVQISTGNDQGERREFSQNQTHRSSVDCSFHFEQFDINKPTFNLTTSTHDPPAIINDRHQQVDSLIHHIDSHALKLTSVGGDFNNNNNSNHQPLINGTSFTTLLHDHQPGLNSSNQHIQDSYCDQSLVNNQHPEELYHNSYTHDGGNLQQQPQQQQQQQQQQFHQQDNYYQHEESQKSFESDLNGQIADRGSSQHLSSVSFDSRPTNNSSLVTYEQEQHFSQFQSSYPQQQNMQTEVNTQFDEHRHLYQISETFSDNNHQVKQQEFSTNDAMCNQNVCKKPINESYTSLLQLTLDCTNHINQVSTTNTLLSDSPTQIGDKCRASKGKRGRPRKKNSRSKHKANGKLWEFIRDLLLSDRTNPSFIRWERREDGVFKFVQSDKVAKMWGERKQNPKMTYEKLSRAMRYYYKSKVLLPVFGRRLVYKFGPNATGWLKMIE